MLSHPLFWFPVFRSHIPKSFHVGGKILAVALGSPWPAVPEPQPKANVDTPVVAPPRKRPPPTPRPGEPLHPLANAFIDQLNQLNERWQSAARTSCKQFCAWLQEHWQIPKETTLADLELAEVTPATLTVYAEHLAEVYSNRNTRRGKLLAIRRWFQFLHAHGFISRDPALNLPRVRKQPSSLNRHVSSQQVRAFLDAVVQHSPYPERDVALFGCLAALGLRPRELLQMRIDDLDLYSAQVRILGKGNRERLVPLNGTLLLTLERYLAQAAPWQEGDLLWLDLGAPLSMHKLRKLFHTYREAAGIPDDVGGPHLFRHYFISQNLKAGVSLHDLAAVVGHANIRSLEAYFHVSTEELRSVLQDAQEEVTVYGAAAGTA